MSIFSKVSILKPKRNKFDLSHEKKFSLDMGYLYPVLVQDILPGDVFRVNSEVFLRFAPLLAPVMHRIDVTMHYFFVPNRLVHDEWEDFITGGRTGLIEPVSPYFVLDDTNNDTGLFRSGTLADFMGLPSLEPATPIVNQVNISALPFRAYQLIYNEYYRDQNLEAEVNFGGIGSGIIASGSTAFQNLMVLRRRNFQKDYFTSALPWAQRGNDVTMPVETIVDTAWGKASGLPLDTAGDVLHDNTGQLYTDQGPQNIELRGEGISFTINELRRSIKVQEWLERMARGGARYIEQLASQFGVISSDARLQRPQYLGGGKQPVVISEVLSTFQQEAEGVPQGNMAGHGVSVGSQNYFKKAFEEHGFVIGIMSVTPKPAYQQGICRMLTRHEKFDYAWPIFGNLGEQEINAMELYYNPASAPSFPTFGYVPRYSEYKYGYSTVHGDFKDTLSFWHLGRIFESEPYLNSDFIRVTPGEFNRVFATGESSTDKMYCQLYHKIDALRPLPYYGTPMI